MRPAVLSFAPLLLLPLLACDSYPAEPEASSVAEVQQAPAQNASVIPPPLPISDLHLVSGNLTRIPPCCEWRPPESAIFTATVNPSGVHGSLVWDWQAAGEDEHFVAKITCATVVGNEAWLEADIIVRTDWPPDRLGWRLLDGGDGPASDMMSEWWGFVRPGEFCDGLPDVELAPILTGDIVVR